MKYSINSQGMAVEVEDNASIVRFLDSNVRFKELKEFVVNLTDFLSDKGYEVGGKSFAYMVQPFYTNERLLYFAKTEFSSTSKAVKLANEIEKHPEVLADRSMTEFLKSIFQDTSSGSHRWYFLNVGYIAFERNLYDGKRINMKAMPPVPYAQFIRELSPLLITPEEEKKAEMCPHFRLKTDDLSLQKPEELLKRAYDRDIQQNSESNFDKAIQECVAAYMQQNGFAYRDKTSNRAISCLSAINESKDKVYPIYEQVKTCVKKNFKGSYGICYKGNCITGHLNDDTVFTIYVNGTPEHPQFLAGGKIYTSLEQLKDAIASRDILQETKWYAEKVKPHILPKTQRKIEKLPKKDEIGWTYKPKKSKKRNSSASKSKSRKEDAIYE